MGEMSQEKHFEQQQICDNGAVPFNGRFRRILAQVIIFIFIEFRNLIIRRLNEHLHTQFESLDLQC